MNLTSLVIEQDHVPVEHKRPSLQCLGTWCVNKSAKRLQGLL